MDKLKIYYLHISKTGGTSAFRFCYENELQFKNHIENGNWMKSNDERMEFFRAWIRRQQQHQHLAYDVTSFSSYAKGIADTEWGYNRDGERLPQINLGCYLGEQNGLPMFYANWAFKVPDLSWIEASARRPI